MQLAPTIAEFAPKTKNKEASIDGERSSCTDAAKSSPLKNIPQLPPTGEAEHVERVRLLGKRGRPYLFYGEVWIAIVLND